MIYKVTLRSGYCGLIEAGSLRSAQSEAVREEGTANVESVVPATKEDVMWIRTMGGFLPAGAQKLLEKEATA